MISTLIEEFILSTETLHSISYEFQNQLKLGLEKEGQMIKALPTFITHLPTGKEKGEYLVADLGGSNLRVGCAELLGDGRFKLDRMKWELAEEMKKACGKTLFNFIVESIHTYLEQCKSPKLGKYLRGASGLLGFTFSYPVKQEGLAHGRLIQWSKAIECYDIIGMDVVQLLQEALEERGLGNIKVVVLLNDTVGTMIAHSYVDPDTRMGVVLGTGTNVAYVEDIDSITKLQSEFTGAQMVINVEWGAFGDGTTQLLPLTGTDRTIDSETVNPGKQIFEKMVSGMYLGEVVRLLLEQAWGIRGLGSPFALSTHDISQIEETHAIDPLREILKERIPHMIDFPDEKIIEVKRICRLVVQRSAQLCAAAIAGLYQAMGSPSDRTVVAFDGSVYEHYPGYRKMLADTIDLLLPGHPMEFHIGKDESMMGAAVVLATTYEND